MTAQAKADEVLFSRGGVSMEAVSVEVASIARTNSSRILNRFGEVGQKPVADGLGRDVSTVCKWLSSGEMDRVGTMLALLGLKVVPNDWQVVDLNQVGALLTLTKVQVAGLTVDKLIAGAE